MCGKIDGRWKMFYGETWDAARDAAYYASCDVEANSVANAAWDALASVEWDTEQGAVRDVVVHAAWNTAWRAVLAAARRAGWDMEQTAIFDTAANAGWDAALCAACLLAGKTIRGEFIARAKEQMEVWKRGYGLQDDVDGILYVFAVKRGKRK